MTDKAPERLWVEPGMPGWIDEPDTMWTFEYVREDIYNEAKMQSLADLGQAQDALEAQKKAEAERDKLNEAAQAVVDFTGYAPEAQRVDVWNMRIAKLNAALGEAEK